MDNKDAIYGHIPRNIILCMKFAELMNPILNIYSIIFDNKSNLFKIKVSIVGCLELNYIKIKGFKTISDKYFD